jgi:DNA recombination-dependent growth factor C
MWLKNLQVYRLPAPWAYTPEQLEAALAPQSFVPPTSAELMRAGWESPRDNGALVHVVNKQMLIKLSTEKKLLPASVITAVAKAKAAEMEEAQGFAPGRKAMKELKEQVADELLPRAFPIRTATWCWIDPVNGWLVVDSASASRADDVIKLLLKAVDRMPLESLRVQRSPVGMMTTWLETDEAPAGFTIDQDTELRATGESRAAVRYVRHTLEVDDIRRHIAAGKHCTRLAMTWSDKISFVLDESLTIKGVKPLDVIKENDFSTRNEEERFDNDMMLMTGELALMLADLVLALGGEASDLASPAGPLVAAQSKVERAVGLTAELYKVRALHRDVLNEMYFETVQPVIDAVREHMRSTGDGAIAAALALNKALPAGSSAGQMFLVAAVEIMEPTKSAGFKTVLELPGAIDGSDPLYAKAVEVVRANQRASISLVQRHLTIGYNRAARLLEAMEKMGVVSAMTSNGNREILKPAA